MISCCEQLEIDTKDICLLCLVSGIDNNYFGSRPTLPSLQGLKHLLRYLKVSPKELFNCSSEFLQSMEIREDIDLKISLCSKCSSVTEKFNKLYQEYELIQLQFSDCVQSLHESISNGNENPERVRKYKNQMRPIKSADLVNASIAANLRNETLKKCSLQLQLETPRVRVALEKPEVEKCSNLPETNSYESCSESSNEIQNLHHKVNSGRAQRKPIKTKMGQKRSFFNSIRKKFKTKQQPIATTSTSNGSHSVREQCTTQMCEHCGLKFSSQRNLTTHMSVVHSEHYINKFLPPNISLEVRKQGVQVVWKQLCEISTQQCQFCQLKLYQKAGLKVHMMNNHAEEFAAKVLETIQSFPESTEDMSTGNKSSNEIYGKSGFLCEFCNSVFLSRNSLKHHKSYAHPEHIVYKFFPPDIPLESCKQGVDAVIKQMKQTSEAGYKCKFCTKKILRRAAFKIHVVSKHGEQIAAEAQQCIGLLPKRLEGVSSDAAACSSTRGNEGCESNPSESINESNRSCIPVGMDFEFDENRLLKIENPPPERIELNPVGMNDIN